MVTPPYKGGFAVSVEGISEDGSHLEARSLGVFSHPKDTGLVGGVYQMTRGVAGWESLPFDAPFSTFSRFSVESVGSDFAHSLWIASSPERSSIPGIYIGIPPSGPFSYVGPSGPTSVGTAVLRLAGTSRDLSHSVYRVDSPSPGAPDLLWPGDRTTNLGQPSLYEYTGTENGEPRLVGIGNEGSPNDVAAGELISECGTYLGGPAPFGSGRPPTVDNALSESGATTYFTALGADYPGCAEPSPGLVMPPVNQIYARLDASQSDARTVAISEPVPADCATCTLAERRDAEFEGASADGARVFFATEQHLFSQPGEGPELYEYDFRSPPGQRVSLVSGGDPAGAHLQHVLGVSDDGSHVYFAAQGVLTEAPNSFGKRAEAGAENLYVYERDDAFPHGRIAFIGQANVSVAQTTRDGRFLVFASTADLTPDEDERIEAGQVFEYDAQTGSLVRVSRGADGYNEDGNSEVYAATIPSQISRQVLPIEKFTRLAVSADGVYVFFTTEDGLTPQAESGVNNVYEYHNGRITLISDGHDNVSVTGRSAVALLGTDETGTDVYFETADALVPQDTDSQLDVYDARVEGGFPSPPLSSRCSPEACQGPFSAGLSTPPPPSSSAAGEVFVAGIAGGLRPPAKTLTRTQELAKALKACRKIRKATERLGCERRTRKRYGRSKR